MIATRPADMPEHPPADRAPLPRQTAGPSALGNVVGLGARLGLLVCAGFVVQLGWTLLWTLSYRLTHGNEFTYNYLVSQPLIWEKLRDLQVLANTLIPGVEILDVGPVHSDILYIAMVAGFVLTGLGYLAAILLIDLGIAAVRGALLVVVGFAALHQITLFLLPGLFTTDIFSYLMYGQISADYGLNPYTFPPNYFPSHPLMQPGWIHPIWHDQPTVYGPLWTAIGWIMARVLEPFTLTEGVFAYKLLLNAVQVINLALVWWLLGRLFENRPRARLTGFVVFAWNPLMQFDTAGNAHNDALMVTFLLLSVVPLVGVRGWGLGVRPATADRSPTPSPQPPNPAWAAGLVGVALGALIKYTTVLVGLFYALAWARRMSWSARIRWLGATGVVVGVLTVGLFLPWLDFPRSLEPILRAADGKSWQFSNSAPDVIAMQIDNKLLNPPNTAPPHENPYFYGDIYETPTTASTRSWLKVITRTLFVIYLVWELWRLWQVAGDRSRSILEPVLRASVRAFTVLILLVFTWVLEWYWMWPLALASLLGWRNMLTKVVVVYTLTALPIFYAHHYWHWHMPSSVVFLYAFPPLALPVIAWASKRVSAIRVHMKPALVPTTARLE